MRIGILANVRKPRTKMLTLKLIEWLVDREHQAIICQNLVPLIGHKNLARDENRFRQESDLVVAIGGDGTILAAARAVGLQGVPILGVNLGTLGFLAEVNPDKLFVAMEKVAAGSYEIEERMLVKARVGERGRWAYALNDLVIDKGGFSRVIELNVSINGIFVGSYKADGLIISTPTGSTAYALSAGGPIVNPKMKALITTPICPHSLAVRPLIIDIDELLMVEVYSDHEGATLTIDGQVGRRIRSGDVVTAAVAHRTVKLVRVDSKSFYEILRTKLKWGIKPTVEE
jgi:NAD+ kinase